MQLYFIRHAQSENNAHWGDENYQESNDPELTQIAHSQVDHLARFLGEHQNLDKKSDWNSQNRHGFGLTHIFTSLMVRAVGTALPVAKSTGLRLVSWPEIHETGGIFSRIPKDEMAGLPGKPRSYFAEHFPSLVLPDWLDESGWWNRPFEERDARQPRGVEVWKTLLEQHGDQPNRSEHRVAIVSHGGFFNYLLAAALGIELRAIDEHKHAYWFLMINCGITRIDFRDGQVLLAYLNRTDFLPDHLIT